LVQLLSKGNSKPLIGPKKILWGGEGKGRRVSGEALSLRNSMPKRQMGGKKGVMRIESEKGKGPINGGSDSVQPA